MFSPIIFKFSKSNSCLILLFFLSSFHHSTCFLSQPELGFCNNLFQCGNLTAGFPFWGGSRPEPCGHPSLVLHCNKSNNTLLIISGQMYSVLQIDNSTNTLRFARQDFLGETFCNFTFTGTTLTSELFELSSDYKTLFVYYLCDPYLHNPSSFTCPKIGVASVHQNNINHEKCDASFNITVPKSYYPEENTLNLTRLGSVLRDGFKVKVKIDNRPCQGCQSNGGMCGYDVANPLCLLLSELKREDRNLSGSKSLDLSSSTCYTQFQSSHFQDMEVSSFNIVSSSSSSILFKFPW